MRLRYLTILVCILNASWTFAAEAKTIARGKADELAKAYFAVFISDIASQFVEITESDYEKTEPSINLRIVDEIIKLDTATLILKSKGANRAGKIKIYPDEQNSLLLNVNIELPGISKHDYQMNCIPIIDLDTAEKAYDKLGDETPHLDKMTINTVLRFVTKDTEKLINLRTNGPAQVEVDHKKYAELLAAKFDNAPIKLYEEIAEKTESDNDEDSDGDEDSDE